MSGGANLGSRLTADMAAEGDIHIRDHVLYELARDLSSSLELDSVLRNVMDRVISRMHATRGFSVLVDPVTNEMSVQMAGGETDTEKSRHFLGSKTVIDHVVKSGKAVVSTDASLDDRFKGQQSVILQNLRSIIAVPLVTKGKVIGAVYVDNPFRAAIFEEKDKEFLQAISDLAAIAIDNARQYERAYEAAQAMVLEVDRLNAELSVDGLPTIAIGIGLDTGEVVAGHVGSDKRLEFTLIGVPVNNSAYLSKVRPPRVLMSEATRDALQNKVSVVDYEPMLLKGASQKQPIFQLEILEVTTES